MEFYIIPTRLRYDICYSCATVSFVTSPIFGLVNIRIRSVQTRVESGFGDSWRSGAAIVVVAVVVVVVVAVVVVVVAVY